MAEQAATLRIAEQIWGGAQLPFARFPDHQHRRIEHTSRLSLLDLNAFRSVQLRLALIELQILLRLTPEYKATRVRGAAAPILQSINTFPTSNGRGTVRIERLRNPFSVLVPIIRGSCRSKMSRKDWLVRARRNLLGT